MVKRNWHKNFFEYMEMISNHPNYSDLPIEYKKNGDIIWLAPKNSDIGKGRIEWAHNKIKALDLDKETEVSKGRNCGTFAPLMFHIHPTKKKVCQICGEEMSLKYIYPNKNFTKMLVKNYDYSPNSFDTIYDINDFLTQKGLDERALKELYICKLNLPPTINADNISLEHLVDLIEKTCRSGINNTFGPGAMSNFPDRFDGYHSYNRCCRSKEDTGRSTENLKTYGKDRRAYEYWSDGNIHAANNFMVSSYFKGQSADHIGPISLGFKHDPLFLQPMNTGKNSSKRDTLTELDFNKLISIEKQSTVSPVSWFAQNIWNELKNRYEKRNLNFESARLCLKNNMMYFMEILWEISEIENNLGEDFLKKYFILPKIQYFKNDYTFNECGEIITVQPRRITDSTKKEFNRFVRISFDAVYDFHEKNNRSIKVKFSKEIEEKLKDVKKAIKNNPEQKSTLSNFKELIVCVQDYMIEKFL